MFHLLAVSEVLACASAGASMAYLTWRHARHRRWPAIVSPGDECDIVKLQSLYGYNEHTFVLDPEAGKVWSDAGRGGICYVERGNVWLVTGEPLAAEGDLCEITRKFISHARQNRKLVVFLPTSERFARAVCGQNYRIHKIATSPYFDLEKWDPRGNPAKGLRLGLNRARRAGVGVERVADITPAFQGEVNELSATWLGGRSAGLSFGWLFRLAPFQNAEAKRYFAARDAKGQLVGLLAASPIPARDGWYLEDVLRRADAPTGTADLLVFEALRGLAADGAKLATLGTVPLSDIGGDELSSDGRLLDPILNFTRRNLKPIYNIEGLRCFKSKFVPSWWENEYVVVSKGYLQAPRTGLAILRVIFGDSLPRIPWLFTRRKRVDRPDPRPSLDVETIAPKVFQVINAENSLNQKSHAVVKVR